MNATNRPSSAKSFLLFFGCLLAILLVFFARSFQSDLIVFSNDGPLGINAADASKLPDGFKAWWWDLNWVGNTFPAISPNFSGLMRWLLGPVFFAKFFPLGCLLVLGLSGWFYFRTLRFHPVVCAAGGIAAALNSNMFSNMAWGQGSRALAMSAAFLAMAAIQSARTSHSWIKIVLAGLAVGWGVSEGFDIGALFSIFIALFAMFITWISEPSVSAKIGKGAVRVGLIAIFAGLLAAQTITSLLTTQIKDRGAVSAAAGLSEEEQWRFITDLSTPKLETLGVVVPGLFGYATTTPSPRVYWGQQSRYNGSGEYAGILVVVVAFMAIAFSFKKDPSISSDTRKQIWFWAVTALIALVLAFGKNAPFYKLIYPFPFFSTMRNPMKFMHVFHLCLVVLFGMGLQLVFELYLKNGFRKASAFKAHLSKWWSAAPGFERKLTGSILAVLAVGVLGWLIYSSSRKDIVDAVQQALGLDPNQATQAAQAAQIASFSIATVGWFVLFFALSAGALIASLSGWFSGKQARLGLVLLTVILTVDLVRANYPWVIYWNYKIKYASNPIIDILREKPYEKRADIVPIPHPEMQWLSQLFGVEWAQHHFFFYNIQSSHVVQDPRPAPDDAAFRKAMSGAESGNRQVELLFRKWELLSTRYLLWLGGPFVDALNQQFPAAAQGRFKTHTRFDLVPRPGLNPGENITLLDLTATVKPDGKYALVEFTGALPKASLYSSWQVISNEADVLKRLTSAEFDPHTSVIVQEPLPFAPAASNSPPGTVEFVRYSPREIEFSAQVKEPALFLLNDKFHPDWKVWVDGKPEKVFRANSIMRGVPLSPGKHSVVFKYQPGYMTLYVTISAMLLAVLLCAFLYVRGRKAPEEITEPAKK